MKIISLFNNKGGVGKSTLAYHTSWALAELGKKVLMMDLDPQCNLTVHSIQEQKLHSIWKQEDKFIDDFDVSRNNDNKGFEEINKTTRTIHYLLKPTEDGTGELGCLPPAINISKNLDLIPGRLTLYIYENKIAERWSSAYLGDALAIRTITKIRALAIDYSQAYNYDYVVIDTSPSLGALNKVIISTVDGFIIPCLPDMFSLYGIRNIGNSLKQWKKEFDTIYKLISDKKRDIFPKNFVQFLGYTIYNARKYDGAKNKWNLATAHYAYAQQIPFTIREHIDPELRKPLTDDLITAPIGGMAVMYSHNTFTEQAQKYHVPIWKVPECNLDSTDKATVSGNRKKFLATKDAYKKFANDLLQRLDRLDG